MARELLFSAVVNQKLAFARIALSTAESQDLDNINGRVAMHAHLDAAVAQLCGALSYFAAELAEQYSVSLDPGGEQLPELLDEFAAGTGHSSELAELLALRKQSGSWLQELLRAKRNPLFLPQRFRSEEEGSAASSSPIPVMNISGELPAAGDGDTPVELVRTWVGAAQSLVDRLRASLHEE